MAAAISPMSELHKIKVSLPPLPHGYSVASWPQHVCSPMMKDTQKRLVLWGEAQLLFGHEEYR